MTFQMSFSKFKYIVRGKENEKHRRDTRKQGVVGRGLSLSFTEYPTHYKGLL